MTSWRDLGAQLDAAVDAAFGERVRVLPMSKGEADWTRPIQEVIGKFHFGGDTITTAGGPVNVVRTGEFVSRMAEAEIVLTVAKAQRRAPILQGDRVHPLEGDRADKTFEVSFVAETFDGSLAAALLMLPETA